MLTTENHVLSTLHAALLGAKQVTLKSDVVIDIAESYIDSRISLLLLPKALELYAPRRYTHFILHECEVEVPGIKFETDHSDLKNIKFTFDANHEQEKNDEIVPGIICQNVFWEKNPTWVKTPYSTHLYQDRAWNFWLNFCIVDYSMSHEGKFIYKKTGEIVNEETFKEHLKVLNTVYSNRIIGKIYEKFGIIPDEEWFKKHVYDNLCKNYSPELAEYTWNDIKLPTSEYAKLPKSISENDLKQVMYKIENDTLLV